MIKMICGGKKNEGFALDGIQEYEKRLRKPYDLKWEFYDEEKLAKMLAEWPFSHDDYVILTDERGKMISSPDFASKLDSSFTNSRNVIILIGGAYGFSEDARRRADFVWSFSDLVFPHQLFRLMVTEQIYRAQEINRGSNYHHM